MLKRIDAVPCSVDACRRHAYYSYNNLPICHYDMSVMSNMNSDNEEAFYDALVQPLEVDGVYLTFPTTSLSALCAAIYRSEQNNIAVLVHDENGLISGRGLYTKMTTRSHVCQAPFLIPCRAEVGTAEGLSYRVETYSKSIIKCVQVEFREEERTR